MDFLGLRTLTVIHDTEMAVRHTKDPDFRIANLDYDDPDTYAMLAKVRRRVSSSLNPRA